MRRQVPIEYGDNFPVTAAHWNPAVPWRFPNAGTRLQQPSVIAQLLPWVMLGLGMSLGVLWMSWRMEAVGQGVPVEQSVAVPEQKTGQVALPPTRIPVSEPVRTPRSRPARIKSQLA